MVKASKPETVPGNGRPRDCELSVWSRGEPHFVSPLWQGGIFTRLLSMVRVGGDASLLFAEASFITSASLRLVYASGARSSPTGPRRAASQEIDRRPPTAKREKKSQLASRTHVSQLGGAGGCGCLRGSAAAADLFDGRFLPTTRLPTVYFLLCFLVSSPQFFSTLFAPLGFFADKMESFMPSSFWHQLTRI